MAWGPPCRLLAAWVPGEGGCRGGSLSGGRALHNPVSSLGAGPPREQQTSLVAGSRTPASAC